MTRHRWSLKKVLQPPSPTYRLRRSGYESFPIAAQQDWQKLYNRWNINAAMRNRIFDFRWTNQKVHGYGRPDCDLFFVFLLWRKYGVECLDCEDSPYFQPAERQRKRSARFVCICLFSPNKHSLVCLSSFNACFAVLIPQKLCNIGKALGRRGKIHRVRNAVACCGSCLRQRRIY